MKQLIKGYTYVIEPGITAKFGFAKGKYLYFYDISNELGFEESEEYKGYYPFHRSHVFNR